MLRLTTLAICVLLLGWGLTAPVTAAVPSAAKAPRCAGEKATIVGTPGLERVLRGTERRDVIVTNGQQRVNAGGGPDLICATGKLTREVVAGSGHDRVLVPKQRRTRVDIWPGDGSDHVLGGKGSEYIRQVGAHGRDTLTLRHGNDTVVYSPDRARTRKNYRDHDRVHLGAGDDHVSRYRVPLPSDGSVYDGGAGQDSYGMSEQEGPTEPIESVDIDMRDGTVRANDRRIRVRSFEDFGLVANGSTRVTYVGTRQDDTFSTYPGPISARMRGGDDTLFALRGTPQSAVDGGSGTDLLGFTYSGGIDSLTADLTTGTATAAEGGETWAFEIAGFENARAHATVVRIVGTDGPNLLQVEGCDVEVHAGAGDDVVRWNLLVEDPFVHCEPTPGARFHGEAGDDLLVSGFLDDTLSGGPGDDTAKGGAGQDGCEAETRVDCES